MPNQLVTATAFLLACLLTPLLVAQEKSSEAPFEPLFNSQDLTGWVRVNTAPTTWSVRDGLLVCSGKPIGELRTTRMYQNFILELEWRHMKLGGNAGVFVWADSITARGVPFHRGIEVQVLENAYGNTRSHTTHGDIFPIHGATMVPLNGRGGSRAFPTEFRSNPSPEWNHYRIECQDGTISLAVNGKVVTRGQQCRPKKGFICLESEGGLAHYRNIRIQELPETPLDDADVAMPDMGYRCLYLGLDLDGWAPQGGEWKANDWVLSYRSDSPGTLTTKEIFGDLGFIVDWRQPAEGQFPTLVIRGATIKLDPSTATSPQTFASVGNWNRLEGTLRGDRLSVAVNGKQFLAEQTVACEATGPVQLRVQNPIEFANLYVRP